MSCGGKPEGAPLTLKELIHELTADFTLADEPVVVSVSDPYTGWARYDIIGISVRTGRDGKSVQSLKLRPVEEAEEEA